MTHGLHVELAFDAEAECKIEAADLLASVAAFVSGHLGHLGHGLEGGHCDCLSLQTHSGHSGHSGPSAVQAVPDL